MIEVDSEHNVDSISLTCGAVQLSHEAAVFCASVSAKRYRLIPILIYCGKIFYRPDPAGLDKNSI